MSLAQRIEAALANCRDQQSFLQKLLHETLEWPVAGVGQVEKISYSWSADELKIAGLERQVVDGRAWQIQPLQREQPWGIFVLEFKNPDALLNGRGMAAVLRRMLRVLVSSRRKDASLPSWKRDHLLFICTYRWERYRFAYFRSKSSDSHGSRLTTFGWEPGKSSRTVCEFNLPALLWPADPTNAEDWVIDWTKAFDKERLTSDFFQRFNEALEQIKSDLEKFQNLNSADAYTQAQLLLERLIFLYFLQNRGWLNQDRGYLPRHLDDYLTKPDAFNYYKEFLDIVFWTLSSAPGSIKGRLPGIPFLNGGLFDDDEFSQPNDSRMTNPPLRIRNRTFQFVFRELLEAFNFTVTEDTPLNQEVAVDPEMLGKVFESIVLHAEQVDPDATAPDKRKATGSYYTPRVVVHFICQEVLFQYLRNHLPPLGENQSWDLKLRAVLAIDASDGLDAEELEKLLKAITPEQAIQIRELAKPLKCCDPAVGSGAFPVGLLHELVNLRRLLEGAANGYVDPARREGSKWLQDTKKEIVQNCLFGVDVQQQAIEICRLRLWLSLVVDYDLGLDPFKADKTQFNHAIDGISQLPNLEMNFHRGDSLHDHISGVPIVIMPEKASRYAEDFRTIADRGENLYRAKRSEQKRKLRIEILDKRLGLSERIIADEQKALSTDESALDKLFRDETVSSGAKRSRIAHEKNRLHEALVKIEKDRKELEKLNSRGFDSQFYVKLRKLEGADFDSPLNFAWYVDFPGIFAGRNGSKGGFDIVVGNPPFVTARNPQKRELWRQRWPRVCHQKYHLLAPFLECGFGLLKRDGELGFIVSNAFAKRDFGKPLVENFLSSVRLQKIVDCSGLMFPGHGTPTCILFGSNSQPDGSPVRIAAILPGGGDLRTPPENSPLWLALSENHDCPGFANDSVSVSDRLRKEMATFPWTFQGEALATKLAIETELQSISSVSQSVGPSSLTRSNEVFVQPLHLLRQFGIEVELISPFIPGDAIRNYCVQSREFAIVPYDEDYKVIKLDRNARFREFVNPFKSYLENVIVFGKPKKLTDKRWYEFTDPYPEKNRSPRFVVFSFISTHNHFIFNQQRALFPQSAPVIKFQERTSDDDQRLICGLCNASTSLFWLKQVAYNKGAGEDEKLDRFEYAGNIVNRLPVPRAISEHFIRHGAGGSIVERLEVLSEKCLRLGSALPCLSMKVLFEKEDEAYQEWRSKIPGYVSPGAQLGSPFESALTLRHTQQRAQAVRNRLRAEMIALQEEIDWVVYAAYRLVPENHLAAQTELDPEPLEREERPFVFWTAAEGNYDRAIKLIPSGWPVSRKKLWEVRLALIRDNEHIRRIEQPVYKRRWDEQWKVGNQWRCGPIAYATEFVDAFEWWLREKAEWWLQHKENGRLVEFDKWAQNLWKDGRIQAAWPVAVEEYARLAYEKAREKAEENDDAMPLAAPLAPEFGSFKQKLREIVDEETVPEGFPFGTPYDELEKRDRKIPAKLRKVRGKLNVPRERFHLRGKTQYLWAGLQFER